MFIKITINFVFITRFATLREMCLIFLSVQQSVEHNLATAAIVLPNYLLLNILFFNRKRMSEQKKTSSNCCCQQIGQHVANHNDSNMLLRPKAKLVICYFILFLFFPHFISVWFRPYWISTCWCIVRVLKAHRNVAHTERARLCVWQMKFMPSMKIVKVAAKANQRSKCHAKVAATDVRSEKWKK